MISQVMILSHRLSSIDRFTMEKLFSRESVLEHVGMVALFTLALTTELTARDAELDEAEALSRALAHDVDEVVTGDVARPTKYASAKSIRLFAELSELAIDKVAKDLYDSGLRHFSNRLKSAFVFAKTHDAEGAVVALADVLAVVAKVRDEVSLRGNRGMVRQAHTARRQLTAYRGDRIGKAFPGNSAAREFLATVVDSAVAVLNEVVALDSPDLRSEVEEY